ncbi:hypothetical protein [Fibrobacter sp.]|uniref:hypothetical protein n=1 Tax=Fibrobacter sp. TaxID=35828 RepID=UPI0025BE8FA1|nr:hypothetical protein [Fibrobacter sp.]MBR4007126.1 hypothetical protein [Fibrobacter sp.]
MRILGKKWWTLAAALPVAALVACTSNSPVEVVTPKGQVYSEDEYEELVEQGLVDESGNVIEEDEEEGAAGGDANASSSSGSKTASSSDSKTASSSDSKTTSSSDSKSTSSDSKTESSSSAKASSDSGSDKSSSSGAVDSDKSSSSASGDVTSSSSTVRQETLTDGEGNFSVGTNDMEVVSTGEQSELDSLKEILDNGGTIDGFEEVATEFDENTLTYESFDEGDYYCFTGEGEWKHVTRELLGQYIPHYKNGQAWGNLRHFDVKFMDACEGVYFRRKS